MTNVQPERDRKDVGHKLGSEFRKRREEIGITQVQLSNRCGISQAYISQIEKGMRLTSIVVIAKLCDALGLNAPDLISEVLEMGAK